MAMTACAECGQEISTTAKACPKCGAVVPRAKVWPWVVGVPIAILALMLIYGASIPEYERRARAERDVCEQIAAAAHQRYECQRNYENAMANGRAYGGTK